MESEGDSRRGRNLTRPAQASNNWDVSESGKAANEASRKSLELLSPRSDELVRLFRNGAGQNDVELVQSALFQIL